MNILEEKNNKVYTTNHTKEKLKFHFLQTLQVHKLLPRFPQATKPTQRIKPTEKLLPPPIQKVQVAEKGNPNFGETGYNQTKQLHRALEGGKDTWGGWGVSCRGTSEGRGQSGTS